MELDAGVVKLMWCLVVGAWSSPMWWVTGPPSVNHPFGWDALADVLAESWPCPKPVKQIGMHCWPKSPGHFVDKPDPSISPWLHTLLLFPVVCPAADLWLAPDYGCQLLTLVSSAASWLCLGFWVPDCGSLPLVHSWPCPWHLDCSLLTASRAWLAHADSCFWTQAPDPEPHDWARLPTGQ